MAKIQSFNRTNIEFLRGDLEKAFREINEKYGLKIRMGSVRYSPDNARATLEFKTLAETTATGLPPIPASLKWMMDNYNLVQNRNGRILTDYNPRRHKYPFTYTENGKSYKTTKDRAILMFAQPAMAGES